MNIWKKYLQYGIEHGAQIELYSAKSTEDSVSVRDQAIEQVHSATDRGLAIRVVLDHKFGFAYTTSLEERDIISAIDQALTNATYTISDQYLALLKPKILKKKTNLKNYDPKLLKLSPQERLGYALAAEKAAYKADKRVVKTESSSFLSEVISTQLVNSQGVWVENSRTACGLMLEVIAEAKGQMESGSDYQYSTHLKDLSALQVGTSAGKQAANMLGAQSVSTGKYALLLEPKIAANFLSVISPMFSAENIQKNKSLLKNKLNKLIASRAITLLDNPLLLHGLGSYLFDSEGTPGKTKTLINSGRLKSYLYDSYTAAKAGVSSTGNSLRGSLKAEPQIDTSNLYLKPGKLTQQQLISSVQKGIYITNIMGLHTADTISGDYSFGASGYLIEQGKLTHSVKEIAIAGNLLDLLKSIAQVGSDLTFASSIGSPTLLVENIMVAGKK